MLGTERRKNTNVELISATYRLMFIQGARVAKIFLYLINYIRTYYETSSFFVAPVNALFPLVIISYKLMGSITNGSAMFIAKY